MVTVLGQFLAVLQTQKRPSIDGNELSFIVYPRCELRFLLAKELEAIDPELDLASFSVPIDPF